MSGSRVVVVIPAFNPTCRLMGVLDGIPRWVASRVIVVDDGSDDPITARSLWTTVVRRHDNGGVGAAMETGYFEALCLGADIIVKMDCDGQMDPKYLRALVKAIEDGAAYAKGDRTGQWSGMPWVRWLGVKALSWLIGVPDCVNGYTAISRGAAVNLIGRVGLTIHPRFFFESSVLLDLKRRGVHIVNIPMPARYRGEPSSLSPWRCLWEFPWLWLKYRWR